MATVFLAEDLRHRRKVAIKVLKDDISASVGAARFLREIEIAAQLQHPHVLPLLDSGEAKGLLYYVMPFVEGQSLRHRLAREGELPVGDAIRIVMDVADALAYAHHHGVVHRDIKPDNIMLTGRHAVVVDFGVARAVSQATDSSNTLTSLGVALGTPAYMAPEQAVADPHVDQRADIYALGVVAYELLAGRTPFTSASPQQMLAAQVTEKPDPPSRYRTGLSPILEQAIMRCLEKRAADRFQTADELLAVLEPIATPSAGTAPTSARLEATTTTATVLATSRGMLIGGGGAVLLAILTFAGWQLTRDSQPELTLGRSTPLTSEPGLEIQPDISPDGKLVAYAAGNFARMRIFVRPVGGGRTIPLSDDTTAVEHAPKWSPDGLQILFLLRGGVSVAPALGGASRPIIAPGAVRTADWSPDGTKILFVRADTLFQANADGSATATVATSPELHSCAWSPRSDLIACVSRNPNAELPGTIFANLAPSAIMVFPVRGGNGTVVTDMLSTNQAPAWSPDGQRLFYISNRDGPRDVYALTVDGSGRSRGEAQRLTTGLGAIAISMSGDGTRLAYAAYRSTANLWSLPIPDRGVVSVDQAKAVTSGNQVIEAVDVSADGRWIVYDSNLGGRSHIWRVPIDGGTPQQLTNGPADEFGGSLSPDGRFVAYHSWRTGTRDIEILPLAGGEAERVTDTPNQESYPIWSRDGNSILFLNQLEPYGAFVTTRATEGRWSPPRHVASMRKLGRIGWSPQNDSVLMNDLDGFDIRAEAMDGSGSRVIHRPQPGQPRPGQSFWSPNGLIYFKAYDDAGRASFWSISASGGTPRLLARLDDLSRPSSRTDFAVSANRIFFPIEDRQSDIYTVEVTRK